MGLFEVHTRYQSAIERDLIFLGIPKRASKLRSYSAYLSASAGGIRAALLAEPNVVRSARPYAKAMISRSDNQGITKVSPEFGLVAMA
jgi:hypothetical protein